MSKHTPGPWQVRHDSYIVPAVHADRPIGAAADPVADRAKYAHVICTMAQRYGVNGADARLIAAAPELLDALTWAARALDRDHPAAVKARAAIAKATGEKQ